MKYKAIIWDCDGVLIDSEVLSCKPAVEALAQRGHGIPLETYFQQYIGKSCPQAFGEIERETGIKLTDDALHNTIKQRQKDLFNQSLKATPGIDAALAAIRLPMAVASGSELERLRHTLGLTKLDGYFKGHIYSAEMVKKGKPAPDIFLYAADKLGVAAQDCLVIEDGIHGIHGAKAAGMDVYAYVGGSHIFPALRQKLVDLGVQAVMNHMDELLPLLNTQRAAA